MVNATEYSDLEAVACGVLLAERACRSFLFRTGPSFVRALAGLDPMAPLRGPDIWPGPRRRGHGLIVVGSHVGQTSRQLDALRARHATADVELDVAAVIARPDQVAAEAAEQVADGLSRSDVLLYTSRTPVRGRDAADGLAIARAVSAALTRIVSRALAAGPAWVIAKGGITSHDVAQYGLGIRRAEVAGQLFPGMVSLLRPIDAAAHRRRACPMSCSPATSATTRPWPTWWTSSTRAYSSPAPRSATSLSMSRRMTSRA